MSLEDKLIQFGKTEKFKELSKNALTDALRKQTALSSKSGNRKYSFGDGVRDLTDWVTAAITYFQMYMEDPSVRIDPAANTGFDFWKYIDEDDRKLVYINDEPFWEISLHFVPSDAIHRESLYPEKYSAGAYNIVQLLNNGYEANHIAYREEIGTDANGNEVKTRTYSLPKRDGTYFMGKAAAAFNNAYYKDNVFVVLSPIYDDGGYC